MPTSKIRQAEFGLVEGARPARDIPPRTGRLTMPGLFPTSKGTLPVLRTETQLEQNGFAQFEVNPDVILMAAQPHVLVFHVPLNEGGTIRSEYVPDLAMLMRGGDVAVVDFKPAKYARLPRWKAREELIRQAYERDHDATFSVVTDEAIYIEPRRTNIGIMLDHREMDGIGDPEAEVVVKARIARLGLPSTIGDLVLGSDLPSPQPGVDRAFTALMRMALRGQVTLDLGTVIGPGTVVSPR